MDKAHFAQQLRKSFPARSDLAYVKSIAEMPPNTSDVFNVHLADLGFDAPSHFLSNALRNCSLTTS